MFLPTNYFANRNIPPTFEAILQQQKQSEGKIENPNVFELTNQNIGTGFNAYLTGATNQYPVKQFPELYQFTGFRGVFPSNPPTQEQLLNAFRIPIIQEFTV